MTTRQQEALEFIRAKQRVVTIGPSLRELAAEMGIAANAAQQKVTFLRREGFVAENTGQGIVLTEKAKKAIGERVDRQPILRPSGKL